MNPEPPSLEAELRGLRAAPIDTDFLLRLEACAEGTLTQSGPEELRFEASLREIRPAKLDPALLADLEKIFHEVPFPVDEKIVLFPKANTTKATQRRQQPIWAAAAAVALIGAASALLVPTAKPSGSVAARPSFSNLAPSASVVANPAVVPASFNRGVSEVRDEGVVWRNNQPHSVVRVVFKDQINAKDKDGRTYQVEEPRVQYMLVPAHTD